MIVYRRAWWGVAVAAWLLACPMAIIGLPVSVFLPVPLCAGALAGAVAASLPRASRRRSRLASGVRHGVLGAAATLGLLGACSALDGSGLLIVVLLATASPPVAEFWHAQRERRAWDGRWDERDTATPIADLSTADLGLAWRASFCAIKQAQTAASVTRIAEQRRRYLDELELRDPEGIRRWLESDAPAGSDPTRYLSA